MSRKKQVLISRIAIPATSVAVSSRVPDPSNSLSSQSAGRTVQIATAFENSCTPSVLSHHVSGCWQAPTGNPLATRQLKPYRCDHCLAPFRYFSHLRNHMRKIHGVLQETSSGHGGFEVVNMPARTSLLAERASSGSTLSTRGLLNVSSSRSASNDAYPFPEHHQRVDGDSGVASFRQQSFPVLRYLLSQPVQPTTMLTPISTSSMGLPQACTEQARLSLSGSGGQRASLTAINTTTAQAMRNHQVTSVSDRVLTEACIIPDHDEDDGFWMESLISASQKTLNQACDVDIQTDSTTDTGNTLRPLDSAGCSRGFAQKSHLKRCPLTKEKPYTCECCNSGFAQKGHLKRHQHTHTKEKPYICERCNRGFTRERDLNRHWRIHSGVKPYQCDLCLDRFNRKDALNGHKKRVHSNESFAANQDAVVIPSTVENPVPACSQASVSLNNEEPITHVVIYQIPTTNSDVDTTMADPPALAPVIQLQSPATGWPVLVPGLSFTEFVQVNFSSPEIDVVSAAVSDDIDVDNPNLDFRLSLKGDSPSRPESEAL